MRHRESQVGNTDFEVVREAGDGARRTCRHGRQQRRPQARAEFRAMTHLCCHPKTWRLLSPKKNNAPDSFGAHAGGHAAFK